MSNTIDRMGARAIYRWEEDVIGIVLWTKDFEGRRQQVGRPVVFEASDAGGPITEPTLQLSADAARELMDSLWASGVRPTDQGSPGQLAAVEKHLADMRAITFAKLELKAPE